MRDFHYDFTGCTDAEIGYMIFLAKQEWPNEREAIRDRIEYLDDLYEELYRRWACADDSAVYHVHGQRR